MEFLQHLVENSDIAFITAFILGIMTSISPCPLAMNITATAYLCKDITDKRRMVLNGVFYTFGRMLSYTTLASIIYFGASKLQIAKFFQQISDLHIGIGLVIIGIFMFDIVANNIPLSNKLSVKINEKQIHKNYWGALSMGSVLALAFCPYSAILYFGGLIPLVLENNQGLLLPPIFSIATGLPVVVVAWIIAYSLSNIGKFYNKVVLFEKWFKKIIATIFIVVGICYIIKN